MTSDPASSRDDAPSETVTRLLHAAERGDPSAPAELLPLVYDQLRRLAQHHMNAERPGHTLQATALVHEAYAKLVGAGGSGDTRAWSGRAHFFHAAAEAMRRILVDHARARKAGSREHRGEAPGGAGLPRRPLRMPANVLDLAEEQDADWILELDEALTRLATVDPQAATIVRLRFFAGLSVDDTAVATGISPRQVDREWSFAKAWLAKAILRG